jgi:hypothetical protein
MGQGLYVKRDTVPSLIAGEEVVAFSRVKGSVGAPPKLYVVALEPGTRFDWQTMIGPVADPTGFTPGPGIMERGQRATVTLTDAVTDDHNAYLLSCRTGRLAVTLVSPHEARMQFRRRERKTA